MFEGVFGKAQSVPKGYLHDHRYRENNDDETDHYVKTVKGQPRDASSEDMQKLFLPSILGDNPDQNKRFSEVKGDELRFGGYFPIFGFLAGGTDMWNAISTIYDRVILQKNEVHDEGATEKKGAYILHEREVVKVNLSMMQKMSIVARCALVWMRGMITFCQLGIIFAPFDAFANWWYKKT